MVHLFWHQILIVFKSGVSGLALVIIWLIVTVVGIYLFTQQGSPYNLLFGLPLLLLGVTMSISSFYELIVGLVSWVWGRTHCPICDEK